MAIVLAMREPPAFLNRFYVDPGMTGDDTVKAMSKTKTKRTTDKKARPSAMAGVGDAERAPKAKATAAAKPRAKATRGPTAKARPRRRGEALVIVESPTKAKTIGKYLGSGYAVKATIGHVRDLPTRKLGVEIDGGRFTPEYVVIKGKNQTLTDIKKAAKAASEVYLATDPDREGEAIAWHVASQLDSALPMHRVLFHEITKDAIQ
jgi:DNA topoisomerase-1